MTVSSSPRRRSAAWLAALGALLVAVVAAGLLTPSAHAAVNASDYTCLGHLSKGVAEPGNDDDQVAYVFACPGPITGYQIQPQIGDTNFDSAIGVNALDGTAVATDSFSCAGDFPGYGFNCTGIYSGNWGKVNGQFSIGTPICDEPRVDALLTVTYATADSKGVITQYIAGPFDLGRPRGCPASQFSGKTRIPADGSVATSTTAKKKRATTKAKVAAKKTRAKAAAHKR